MSIHRAATTRRRKPYRDRSYGSHKKRWQNCESKYLLIYINRSRPKRKTNQRSFLGLYSIFCIIGHHVLFNFYFEFNIYTHYVKYCWFIYLFIFWGKDDWIYILESSILFYIILHPQQKKNSFPKILFYSVKG